jgi:hypothetical protein
LFNRNRLRLGKPPVIDDLIIGTSANFCVRGKRISASVIDRVFKDMRNRARRPSPNLFRSVRDPRDGSFISAICFSHERAPGFLASEKQAYDRIHGFLLIVERGDYIAVFKSGLELPASFKASYLARANPGGLEAAIATAEAVFEKIRVKSTSSRQGVRAKTVEASNLEASMPMASASGFFTQGYSVVRTDGHFSATPGTGRIAKRGDRGDAELAIEWSVAVMDQLALGGAVASSFILNFARRISLDALPAAATPVVFAVDTPRITELLLSEAPEIRLVRSDPATGAFVALSGSEIEGVIDALGETFQIKPGRPDFRIKRGARSVGTIRFAKNRIGLRQFNIHPLLGVEVETTDCPLGTDEDRKTITRYLDRENLFTILFADPALAYVEGELFRNEAMLDGGANFLAHLIPVPALSTATSEKGAFLAGQTQFSQHSVFDVIDQIAAANDVLVCDDLGDEWADFIGLSTQTRPPSVNFYHGKHGDLTLGASAFHIAVSQAQKNLGRLSLPSDSMESKYDSWSKNYTSGTSVETDIKKIIRGGDVADIRQSIDAIRKAPDTVQHVYIVTSSLSKAAVEHAFADVAVGGSPSAHFVQLYWLLTHYYSACAEMGAVGFIMCQP